MPVPSQGSESTYAVAPPGIEEIGCGGNLHCSKFEWVQVQLIDLFGLRISSMTEIAPANMNALRWDALLAEFGVVEKEHRELLFSFTRPFSAEQNAELSACVARRHGILQEARDLATEWADVELMIYGCDP